MARRLTTTQLNTVRLLQANEGAVLLDSPRGGAIVGREGQIIKRRVDRRGLRGLLSQEILVRAPGSANDDKMANRYMLSAWARSERFIQSTKRHAGGEGIEAKPTWEKIYALGDEFGVTLQWTVSDRVGILYIKHDGGGRRFQRKTPVLLDDEGHVLTGAMHFSTMGEWREFLVPKIKQSIETRSSMINK